MKRYEYMTTNFISQQPGPEWRMVQHLNGSYPFLWERVTEEPEPTPEPAPAPEPGYRWRCIMVHPNSGAWLVSPDGSRVVTCVIGNWHPDDGGVLDRDKIVCGKRYSTREPDMKLVEDPAGPYLAVDDFTGKLWREEGK